MFRFRGFRRRFKPGGVARKMLKFGDLDVTKEGGGRLRIADRLMRIELQQVREMGIAITVKLRTKIAGLARRLEFRGEERDHKNEQRAERIEQARRWREKGVYEKTLHIDLPRLARTIVYIVLSGLDFFVFSEAWAIGTDSNTGEVNWWIGGLLGLVVFGAGFLAAVQLKRVVIARRQEELLAEMASPDPRLVVLAPNLLFLALAGGFFLAMVSLGFLVRLSNEAAEANLFMVAMAALIPLLAAVTELFLYDPMQRSEVRPNLIDRILAYRRARLVRKLELREERIEQTLENIREKYATEKEILRVELIDRGIEIEGSGP